MRSAPRSAISWPGISISPARSLSFSSRTPSAAESEAVDLYRFTSVLKNRMSEDERIRVIENLWEIAYADGTSHEFEENLDLARRRAPRR